MKALILAVALLSTAATAQAEANNCLIIEEYARTVMDVRQGGMSLKIVISTIDEHDKIGHKIVIAAYNKPHYMTASMKQRTIDDFANSAYLECLTNK